MWNKRCIGRIVAMTVAALWACSIAAAQDAGFERHHFKKAVALKLDASRIAVQRVNAARGNIAAPGYSVREGEFQYPLPQWTLLSADAAQRQAGAIEADQVRAVTTTVGEVAKAGEVDFVSPVFIDDLGGPMVVTRDLLIGVRDDIPVARAREIVQAYGEILEEGFAGLPNGFKVRSTSLNGVEVLRQSNELAQKNEVLFAEPDMIATGRNALVPNDQNFFALWGLRNTGQSYNIPGFGSYPNGLVGFDLGAVAAWDTTIGDSSIITVVMDSGVQSDHPDLAGRIITPGVDATGQGGQGEPVSPCDNHGTAVAGCIVATINNGQGIVGIAPGTRVASARIGLPTVPCDGTFTKQNSWIVDVLSWAQSIGARVTNNSNSFGSTSSAIDAAYQSTYNAGIIHFGSSGNDGASSINYPSNIAVVNSVGALRNTGNRAGFSNYGTGLDFSAPGDPILCTDRTGADGYNTSSDYVYRRGTSFASPYAAGVAALILSQRPGLVPSQVEAIMQATARDLGTPGYDTDFGHGLVRADAALRIVNGQCPLTWEQQFDSLPAPRAEHGSAFDSSRNTLVVFGGNTSGSTSGETWEFATGVWQRVATTGPSSRKNVMMAYDSSRQRVVLFGGFSSEGVLGDTWEWNGSAWAQPSLTGPTPPARRTGSMAFDSQRGRVVLYGGLSGSGTILGDTWEFDGSSWTLATHPGPAIPRYAASMAFDSSPGRNVCVLFGGLTAGGYVNQTWEWNGLNWVQRTPPTSPSPRAGQTSMSFDPTRGRCVLFGGESSGGVLPNDLWEFDGSSWLIKTIALPLTRYGNSMAFDSERNQTVLFGGAPDGSNFGTKFSDLWAFDGARWIPVTGPAPSSRFGAGRAYVPELGGAVIFGGQTGFAQPLSPRSSEMWLQSPSGWGRLNSWGPPQRVYPSVEHTGSGSILMFGGLGEFDNGMNDLWRFSDGAWTAVITSGTPPARWGATSCVFTSMGRFVVFGGQFNGSLVSNALHTINAANPLDWVSFAAGGPSARDYAMMAYDPVRDEAILFGGRGSGGAALDDVWRLRFVSGSPQWTQMSSLGVLHRWDSGAMFWDPGRQRILLYGKQQFGFEPGAGVEPTVYEWTGTHFVPIALGAPPSLRRNAMMGPTSGLGDIRLFGGVRVSDSQILGDAWAFNGVAVPSFPLPPTGGGSFERGDTVTLTIPVVIGQSPSLRWSRSGVPLTDGLTPSGSLISGAQTRTLIISNAQPGDTGPYLCTATNACGTSQSEPAQISVTSPCPADFNSDGFVDFTDFDEFVSAFEAGDSGADFNADGFIDFTDFDEFVSAFEAGC